jgi:ElaB/YqjD/DUF883 family membrane-anchored ribosome-binding protein
MANSTDFLTQTHKSMSDHRQAFGDEFSKLNQDLQTILQHVKTAGADMTKDVSKDVWFRMESVASRVSDLNNQISGCASDFVSHHIDKTKEIAQEYTDNLENAIKENPIKSVAISFGIGLFISKVLGSWRSSH